MSHHSNGCATTVHEPQFSNNTPKVVTLIAVKIPILIRKLQHGFRVGTAKVKCNAKPKSYGCKNHAPELVAVQRAGSGVGKMLSKQSWLLRRTGCSNLEAVANTQPEKHRTLPQVPFIRAIYKFHSYVVHRS